MNIQSATMQSATVIPRPALRLPVVVAAGLRPDDLSVTSRAARKLGIGSTYCLAAVKQRAWSNRGANEVLMLDLDQFNDLTVAVDELIEFRLNNPEVKVLAVSRGFSSDDMGRERRAIADHCLKSPLSEQRLLDSLSVLIEA